MRDLRTYGLLTTFGLVLNVSGQLIWAFFPMLDIVDVMAWAVFIAVGAACVFGFLSEPRKRKKKPRWVTNKATGLSLVIK